MPVNRLVDIIWPTLDDSWFTDVYMGVLPLCCALGALFTAQRSLQRQRRLLYVSFIALGFALALGTATPILPFAAKHIPGFDLFRFAFRYKLVIPFFVCLLAAECLADILLGQRQAIRHWVLPVLGGGWLLATTILMVTASAPVQLHGVRASLVIGGAALVVSTAALVKWNWRPALITLAVVATLFELAWVGQPGLRHYSTSPRS